MDSQRPPTGLFRFRGLFLPLCVLLLCGFIFTTIAPPPAHAIRERTILTTDDPFEPYSAVSSGGDPDGGSLKVDSQTTLPTTKVMAAGAARSSNLELSVSVNSSPQLSAQSPWRRYLEMIRSGLLQLLWRSR